MLLNKIEPYSKTSGDQKITGEPNYEKQIESKTNFKTLQRIIETREQGLLASHLSVTHLAPSHKRVNVYLTPICPCKCVINAAPGHKRVNV